jgi:hypothetical protein
MNFYEAFRRTKRRFTIDELDCEKSQSLKDIMHIFSLTFTSRVFNSSTFPHPFERYSIHTANIARNHSSHVELPKDGFTSSVTLQKAIILCISQCNIYLSIFDIQLTVLFHHSPHLTYPCVILGTRITCIFFCVPFISFKTLHKMY